MPHHRPGPPDSFLTLGGSAEAEIKVQRSRFIALAHPASSLEDARKLLEKAAHRFHDARHVCHGHRMGIGAEAVSRKNDDGEPSGTAGDPILTAIGRLNLTDVLVMVVRYFGGVKLGTGGLARAYGEAAGTALAAAPVKEVLLGRTFVLTFAYSREKTIRRLIDQAGGRIETCEYGAEVVWRIWLPHSTWRGFAGQLTELTAGAVIVDPTDIQGP